MALQVRQLTPQELSLFKELVILFEEVFEMKDFKMPQDQYLQKLLSKNNFFVFVAIKENKIVGGLTAYELPSYYTNSSEIYLYDLAVKNKFQRKGIGRKLLESLSAFCKENNYQGLFVQADAEDKQALEFYQSTGGISEEVIHYSYKIK
jgi:aminoglycoside 3-N-acetyltransferase I